MIRGLCQMACLFLLCLLSGSLTPSVPLASGAPIANELRCQCLKTVDRIVFKDLANLKAIPAGPQCSKLEVIATLKNGKKLCLNPEAPRTKMIVEKLLKGSK